MSKGYFELMVPDTLKGLLPYFASGIVVKGFGRGSKQLGCPTANFAPEVVSRLPAGICSGVYYGWAQLDAGPIYKMVMSIGRNPHFQNKFKTMETHLIHEFELDFYGATLSVVMTGFLREMTSYTTMDALMEAIRKDIQDAGRLLDDPDQVTFQSYLQSDRPVQKPASDEAALIKNKL